MCKNETTEDDLRNALFDLDHDMSAFLRSRGIKVKKDSLRMHMSKDIVMPNLYKIDISFSVGDRDRIAQKIKIVQDIVKRAWTP